MSLPQLLGLKPCLVGMDRKYESPGKAFPEAIICCLVHYELIGHRVPLGPSQNQLSPHQNQSGKCWLSCPPSYAIERTIDLFPCRLPFHLTSICPLSLLLCLSLVLPPLSASSVVFAPSLSSPSPSLASQLPPSASFPSSIIDKLTRLGRRHEADPFCTLPKLFVAVTTFAVCSCVLSCLVPGLSCCDEK